MLLISKPKLTCLPITAVRLRQQKLFNKRNEAQISYNLRNIETDLTLPKPKTEHLKRTLWYSGAKLWKSLPQY
jgi:hypothetical protein